MNQLRVGFMAGGGDRREIEGLEGLPIDSLWTGGHVASRNAGPEAMSSLIRLATLTERVRVGTSILLLPLYPPAIVAKQVGDNVTLVVFEWKQGRTRRDLLGPKQPLLEVMPTRRAFTIVFRVALGLECCDPVLLLAPSSGSKQLQLFGFDVAISVRVLDGAMERRKRKALFDVALR